MKKKHTPITNCANCARSCAATDCAGESYTYCANLGRRVLPLERCEDWSRRTV